MTEARVAPSNQRSAKSALELIQGSLSAGRIARRSPLMGGLHRVADGTLLGVFAAMTILAGLTMHWQHRWTTAYQRFEGTKLLSHRLTEATALLEQTWLDSTVAPEQFVPTKVTNLIHLERPQRTTSRAAVASAGSLAAGTDAAGPRIRPGY